ncbi:MAG: hypothetical protein R6V17_07765, partial [Halanaerobacter sp.]
MENLAERSQLKEILKEVFMPLVEHQEAMQSRLEERVFNEVEDELGEYNIYAALVPRQKLRLLDGLLFPILAEEEEESLYEEEEMIEKIINGEQVVVSKIFLKRSRIEIEDLKKQERVFTGQIVTAKRDYNIKVKLEYNTEYIEKEKELYNIF